MKGSYPRFSPIASRITLKQLRAFVAAGRFSSFTEAGQYMGLSQPALTAAIKQFEELVGVTLFDRTTRRVRLTDDGERFLPIAERLMSDISLAVEDLHELADQRRERVSVSAVYSIATTILPEVVVEFAVSNPKVSISLHDENSAGVCRQVRRNEVDFGFASRDRIDPELDYQLILRDRMGLVAVQNHPLMKSKNVSWEDIADYEYLGLGSTTGPWLALSEAQGVPQSIRAPRIELANIPTLEAMLRSTRGVTSLPALAFPETQSRQDLRYRPLDNPPVMRDLFMITRKGRSMSRAAQRLKTAILASVSQYSNRSSLVEVMI